MKRWVPLGLFVVAAGVFTIVAWKVWFGSSSAVPPGDAVADHSSQPANEPKVFAGGIVEGANRELSLRFELPGRIKSVHVREGDAVKAGDVLAELDCEIAELNLAEARFRLKIAMAERNQLIAKATRSSREVVRAGLPAAERQVRNAEFRVERAQPFSKQDSTNRQEAEQARQKRDRAAGPSQNNRVQLEPPEPQLTRDEEIIAEGRVSLAEAAVRRERLVVEKHRLRAPVDGVVLRSSFEPGELTGPAEDGPLLTLVNRDETKVRAFVEELDALRVSPGQRASVTVAGQRERSWQGVIRTCALDVRPKSHRHLKPGERLDVRVREVVVELDDGAGLLIGLPVEVFFEPTAR